jgi:hypothetical protein
MLRAAWIELMLAMRTHGFGLQILVNGQLLATIPAQNRALIEFFFRPRLSRMPGERIVTLMTRKPIAAAFELNRNNIALVMIMSAARLRIDINAHNLDPVDCFRHAGTRSRGQISTKIDPTIQHAIIIAKPLLNEPLC